MSKIKTVSLNGLKLFCTSLCFLFVGGWSYDAANTLDAAREHHVPAVHHRERCVEPWCGTVGDLHIWQAALVPALQQ